MKKRLSIREYLMLGAIREIAWAPGTLITTATAVVTVATIKLFMKAGYGSSLFSTRSHHCVVSGQLFALHLTMVKGNDPDRPRGLQKITSTN